MKNPLEIYKGWNGQFAHPGASIGRGGPGHFRDLGPLGSAIDLALALFAPHPLAPGHLRAPIRETPSAHRAVGKQPLNRAQIRADLAANEGRVNHLYLDTKGFVTVGIGTMLPNLAAAQALQFVMRGGSAPASAKDIEADFHAVKSQAAGQVAKKYKPHTQLDLPEAHIDALLDAEIAARETSLRTHFPGYDNYPAGPKRALIDMVFNLGMGSLSNRTGLLAFKNMKAAIVASDWRQAAANCHRKGPSDARNAWTHDRFLEAAK